MEQAITIKQYINGIIFMSSNKILYDFVVAKLYLSWKKNKIFYVTIICFSQFSDILEINSV